MISNTSNDILLGLKLKKLKEIKYVYKDYNNGIFMSLKKIVNEIF